VSSGFRAVRKSGGAEIAKDEMIDQKIGEVQASYDRVAEEYVRHLADELRHKPFDRELLERFAKTVRDAGPVCDLGCGPGHVARFLKEHGVTVCGMDLSPAMVEQARKLNPGMEIRVGDMRALDVPDESWAGIAAFYAIVNLPPDEVRQALREMWRVLRPGGRLLMSFHIGDEMTHVDDLWGCAVSLDFYFFRPQWIEAGMRSAGFEIERVLEREPYSPEIEYQSRRAYIFARKSG